MSSTIISPARPRSRPISDAPISLLASATSGEFLSQEECKAVFDRIVGMTTGGGYTRVNIISRWSGAAKWARTRMHVVSDTHTLYLRITRIIRGASGSAVTNRVDDDGLGQAIRDAEEALTVRMESFESIADPFIDEPILHPTLWDDPTYAFGAEARTTLVQSLMRGADDRGLLSAGTVRMAGDGNATIDTEGLFRYYPTTSVECSMTVRDPKGTASGWAGVNHYALSKIDPTTLAATALDKCVRMANPSAVEPGRYTVILEPQAVADLFDPIVLDPRVMDRPSVELGYGPFAGSKIGWTKIGERVLDARLMFRSDPMDPDGGFIPYDQGIGTPYQPVEWIDRGVLRQLAYEKPYALQALNLDKALPNPRSYRLSAAPGVATSSVEAMIAHTQRGILVTRLSGVELIDPKSMLCTGYTRDGLWLIEHGKITKPIKNFRFTESPMFVLNKLEEIGVPQRIFTPGRAVVVPPVRVADFSFTSLADAV